MFPAGYPAAQSTSHSYSQSTQGYGASGYESTPAAAAAAAPAASQSYGSQPGYTAQSAYPGYGQQAAPTAPQRCVYLLSLKEKLLKKFSLFFYLIICLALSLSVTMLTASQAATTKIATPSQQHMGSNSQATRHSRRAMGSSRDTSRKASSSNRLLLLILLSLLVPTVSLQLTSTASKVDPPATTNPTITVSVPVVLPVCVDIFSCTYNLTVCVCYAPIL